MEITSNVPDSLFSKHIFVFLHITSKSRPTTRAKVGVCLQAQ